MKRQKLSFNILLNRYRRYIRKRKNLELANRNHRRQSILTKHIERLYKKLMTLQASIKKARVVATVAIGSMSLQPLTSNAQNFAPAVVNPFSLNVTTILATATLVDLDDDDDLDLMVGELYGKFMYYENVGTPTVPSFDTAQTNPFQLTTSITGYSDPSFADLDGDGDFDMISGGYSTFLYFENIGTTTAPSFGPAQTNPFSLTTPYLGWLNLDVDDIDGDGDFDIITGQYNADLIYYENTGTQTVPTFSAGQVNSFSLTSSTYNYLSPSFIDIDSDGDMDIIAGNLSGAIIFTENIGSATAPTFTPFLVNPFSLTPMPSYSVPVSGDLDNDGDVDLLVSDFNGTFSYFENITPLSFPEIAILGNDIEITSGDTTTSTTNSTDFGELCVNDAEFAPFKIKNSGTDTLFLTAPVSISGLNASDFFIAFMPEDTILSGDSTSFQVQFIPGTPGLKMASITVPNNDNDENNYTFGVSGIAVTASDLSQSFTICNGEEITVGMNSYTTTGTYTDVLVAANGCDSTVTTTLTVEAPIDATTTSMGSTLTANATGATYQWLDCNNGNAPIPGATNQNFTATATGDYSVAVGVGTCTDTSACVNVVIIGVTEPESIQVKAYPNPVNDLFTIELDQWTEDSEVTVAGLDGKIIYSKFLSGNRLPIDTKSWANGVYLVKITNKQFSQFIKLIKE